MSCRAHVILRLIPRIALSGVGLTLVIGCGIDTSPPPYPGPDVTPTLVTVDDAPFGDASDRRHDFGAIVGRPGLALDHTYTLVNTSDEPVEILRAVNLKSCCGTIQLDARTIEPGQAATLVVTIRVGEAIGPISHHAIVETDQPGAERLDFVTTVTAYPRVRIEEAGGAAPSPLPNQEVHRDFVAYAYGIADEPPLPLDETAIESVLGASWLEAAAERSIGGGIIERSRRLSLLLPAEGRVGWRSEEFALKNGEAVVLRHVLTWEVVPHIAAVPKLAVFPRGTRERDIRLHARDETPFQVSRIELDAPGMRAAARGSGPAPLQIVQVQHDGHPEDAGRPLIMNIVTDHPEQANVEVPIIFLD